MIKLYYIKYKLQVAGLLLAIMAIILCNNLWNRHGVSNLKQNVTSMLNDRLKPSNYIYQISNLMYQKRALLYTEAVQTKALAADNLHINKCIASYENTSLTSEETKVWASFKKELNKYNALESTLVNNPANPAMMGALETSFAQVSGHLDQLNNMQVGIGQTLLMQSDSISNNNRLVSYLEFSLLIVLGTASVILVSVSDNRLFHQNQKHQLN